MAARHGSFNRAMQGCDCTACLRALEKARNTVRSERVREESKHLKLGQAVVTTITGANEHTRYLLDDGTDGAYGDIDIRTCLGMSSRLGSEPKIILVMHKPLLDAAHDDEEILATLQEFVSYLAGHMPKSTLHQVIDPSIRRDGKAKYDQHLVRRQDLPEILANLASLTTMLVEGEEPERLVRQYAMLRDQMRQRREEFIAADAAFEVAQALIVKTMGVDA